MSVITSLRNIIEGVLNEAEDRVTGVLDTTEYIVDALVTKIFNTAQKTVNQIIATTFDLAGTLVREVFTVVGMVVTAVLGVGEDESIVDSTISEKEDN